MYENYIFDVKQRAKTNNKATNFQEKQLFNGLIHKLKFEVQEMAGEMEKMSDSKSVGTGSSHSTDYEKTKMQFGTNEKKSKFLKKVQNMTLNSKHQTQINTQFVNSPKVNNTMTVDDT